MDVVWCDVAQKRGGEERRGGEREEVWWLMPEIGETLEWIVVCRLPLSSSSSSSSSLYVLIPKTKPNLHNTHSPKRTKPHNHSLSVSTSIHASRFTRAKAYVWILSLRGCS
jgi:hypothetical protein